MPQSIFSQMNSDCQLYTLCYMYSIARVLDTSAPNRQIINNKIEVDSLSVECICGSSLAETELTDNLPYSVTATDLLLMHDVDFTFKITHLVLCGILFVDSSLLCYIPWLFLRLKLKCPISHHKILLINKFWGINWLLLTLLSRPPRWWQQQFCQRKLLKRDREIHIEPSKMSLMICVVYTSQLTLY